MTTGPAQEHLEARLVVHTHWDREWYRPASQFRLRLVALIDEVLDGAAGTPFLLDGQAVVLEDYLEARPERAADVSRALRAGELEAGPWFVLADALIPSGEGLVRNLLAGRQVLHRLRAEPPGVLYCPDSFGHPAMLPSIAEGFGLPVVILWRGYGGRSHPPGDTALWEAPDESRVVLYHLPPDGYETGSHLPATPETARERWRTFRAIAGPRSITGLALIPTGADHHAPQANLADAIETLARAAAPDIVRRSSVGHFAQELAGRAHQQVLPTVTGELRDSYGYTWTLQGTLGARAALKRGYSLGERDLVRDLEPWVALAWWHDRVDRRHQLRAAWRPLLLCQPHDTLCGCSIDQVARDMAARIGESSAAAAEVRAQALGSLVGRDPNAERQHPIDWIPVVTIRNLAARARGGVAMLDVDVVLDDAPVGPSSAGIEPRSRRVAAVHLGDPAVTLQEVGRSRTFAREEAIRHYPWNRLVERRRILAWVPEVPPLGLATLPVGEGRRRPPRVPSPASGGTGAIWNDRLRVAVDRDALRLTSEGVMIDDWLALEAEGERGDLYTASAIPGTRVPGRMVRARLSARGPLRAELTTDWVLEVPARRLTSAAGEPRVDPPARLKVRIIVQLDAAAPFARVRVQGVNNAPDTRLRLGLRSNLMGARVLADAAFAAVERHSILADGEARQKEQPPATAPLHRFVSLFAGERGCTVYADGLAEYEASADGTVWVTLFRAVGELSRHNLPERPGHAGYPEATPEAQCLGPFEAQFAFAGHGPDDPSTRTLIEQMADDVLLPLQGDTWRTAIAPPSQVPGVALEGDGLVYSAVKPSDDGAWMVLRCVNRSDRPATGAWRLDGVTEARRARLDETELEPLVVRDGAVAFSARPAEVVTILAR